MDKFAFKISLFGSTLCIFMYIHVIKRFAWKSSISISKFECGV
jgi:hypothetical protein